MRSHIYDTGKPKLRIFRGLFATSRICRVLSSYCISMPLDVLLTLIPLFSTEAPHLDKSQHHEQVYLPALSTSHLVFLEKSTDILGQ